MPKIPRFLASLLLILVACSASAQAPDSAKLFDDATKQIRAMRAQLAAEDIDNALLITLRDEAGRLSGTADGIIADRTPKLEALDARLAELGPEPAAGSAPEAPDIRAQRSALQKQRAELDGEIKRARLVVADGQQLAGEIAEVRRGMFRRGLSQRTSSPLLAPFWRDVAANGERDAGRLGALRMAAADSLAAAFAPGNRQSSLIGIAVGLLLLVFGRWGSERLWLRITADRMPQGRLRRSALAVAVLVISTILPGLAAHAIYLGMNGYNAFGEPFASLARMFVNAVYFGGLVTGLGRALLAATRPSWRLAPISDAVAARLRLFPLLLAVIVVLGFMLNSVNSVLGTSLSATIATSFVVAVLYALAVALILLTIRRAGEDAEATERKPGPARPVWMSLALGLLTCGVIATLVAAATGFIAFATFLAGQMIWIPIVAGVFYLLVSVVEDISKAALSERASWARRAIGITPKALEQMAVVFSGLFRVLAFACAAIVILSPLGASPAELLQQGMRIGAGISVGQLKIAPNALFGAIAVLLIGTFIVRTLKRWMNEHYLPTTQLEPGVRSSITTLLGYAGGIMVIAVALSALGLSLERIAWVASALSVGIGFGLQAIVQNFISGLILLIERPVKVGDWVALGDIEGDIRRINVRATEIQMGDRSTMIVPNSELITKTVRNVTLANAEGRVRIRLPLPMETDAKQVRAIVLAAIAAHPSILAKPEPAILLDGIEGGSLIFIVIAYIANPRQSGGVRSDLLIDILARLRAADVALTTPQEISVRGRGDAAAPAASFPPA